jgi:hypothetical protein
MKMLSSDKPFDTAAARNCFIMNQLATPGLGSLMGKRIGAGVGQILLAIAGFLMVLVWFVLTLNQAYSIAESNGPTKSYNLLGAVGGLTFAVSWFWALATSLSLLQEAKKNTVPPERKFPPPITKPPSEI